MPRKPRVVKPETLLELCGGDEVKAASIQNLVIMCGLEFLDWIADETDLWQRLVAGGDKIALFAEMERRCPPAI